MATITHPQPQQPFWLIKRFLEYIGMRRFRRAVDKMHAEVIWLRGQLALATSVNKRISEMNEQLNAEMDQLRHEHSRFAIIDATEPCIVCGHRGSKIGHMVDEELKRVVATKTCERCGFNASVEALREDAYKFWQETPGQDEVKKGFLGL